MIQMQNAAQMCWKRSQNCMKILKKLFCVQDLNHSTLAHHASDLPSELLAL